MKINKIEKFICSKVEMSPGGTTGMLVQGDGAQPSLPVLTDEDGVSIIIVTQKMFSAVSL